MENLKTGNETGHGLVLMEKERPFLEKLPGDRWDHIFAGLYVILGILMWNCLCMENFAKRTVHVFYPLYYYRSCLRRTEKISHNRGKNLLDAYPPGDQSSIRLLQRI